jgi:catechol 2,3-dioxygenase-like lactoylglutathione lyase family enzyme
VRADQVRGHEEIGMKRFHVHVSVHDIQQSIRFYSTLFGADPVVHKDDYAKWMLDDPRINFAISKRASATGVDHLGLQVDSGEELTALEDQLQRADASMLTEASTTCCYAKSDKYWVTDPQGVAWETFRTLGSAPVYGDAAAKIAPAEKAACCGPAETAVPMPRPKAAKPPAACCG